MKNIGEAFLFPFKDPNWVAKFLIGGIFMILCLLLIGLPVVYGYYIELMQRVRRNEQYPLPEWNELGVKFILGFKYLVTLFVYSLPVMLVMIPVLILFVISSAFGSHSGIALGGAAWMTFVMLIAIPYSLAITILTPIISVRFAERERIADALHVGDVFRLFREHWQDALIAAFIALGVESFAGLGLILLIIGVVFTIFYASLIKFHLFGQISQSLQPSSSPTILGQQ